MRVSLQSLAIATAGLLVASASLASIQSTPEAAPAQTATLAISGDPSARIVWQRVFASPGNDWINDIVPLADGSFLAAGFLNRVDGEGAPSDWRALAARLGADGSVLAQTEYGAGGGVDAFWTALEAEDGSRAFAGFTTRIGNRGINAWSLIARADGTIVKENAHGGGGYDRFTDAAAAADGWVFLGHSQLPEEMVKRRIFIVKTDRQGVPVWERIHGGPDSYAALYIEPAGDGGFIIAGGIAVGEDSDVLVLKVDSEGRELWRRSVGAAGTADVNHGLIVRPDGSILVVGYSRSWGARENDIIAFTLSPSGEVVRREIYGGAGDDRAILAKPDAQGRIWIVGQTRSAGAGDYDMIVTSLDREGRFEGGAITVGGPRDDIGTAIRPLTDGSLLVAGYSRNLGPGGEDAFVARLTKPGAAAPHPAFTRREVTD